MGVGRDYLLCVCAMSLLRYIRRLLEGTKRRPWRRTGTTFNIFSENVRFHCAPHHIGCTHLWPLLFLINYSPCHYTNSRNACHVSVLHCFLASSMLLFYQGSLLNCHQCVVIYILWSVVENPDSYVSEMTVKCSQSFSCWHFSRYSTQLKQPDWAHKKCSKKCENHGMNVLGAERWDAKTANCLTLF